MKSTFKNGIIFILIAVIIYIFSCIINHELNLIPEENTNSSIDSILNDTTTVYDTCNITDTSTNFEQRFDAMIYAFGYVESRNNPNAVSKNGKYVGLLQISPILVKECNRIEGDTIFHNEDRFDSLTSIIMFGVIMEEHNPELDLRRACKIWNPKAGDWYYNKINERYKYYLKEVYNIN